MENNLHDIEWIERYLDRSLNAEEKKEMEKRLTAEPDLKSKVREHQRLIQGIRYSHLQNKLEQLRTLETSLPNVTPDEKGNQRWMEINWKPLAAAAVFLLLTISYLIYNQKADPQELYANYFEPYPNVFEPTVRGDARVDKRTEAFNAYDRGDYKKASDGFRELVKEKSEPGVLLLLGNSNLMLGNIEEAQNNFLTLIKDFDELDGQAKWYLGLSYLKQGQKEKAKLIFQELGDPEITYSKKASELLKEVK
jgi:TolA-binding protein